MGKAMNYDVFASSYACTRYATPWVLEKLRNCISDTSGSAVVVEVGCGTGNYLWALSSCDTIQRRFYGIDVSREMLKIARASSSNNPVLQANLDVALPLQVESVDMLFCVDVVHHLEALSVFFNECARALVTGGRLVIVTDSHEDIRSRGLSRYFPEVLNVEMQRYPTIETLVKHAGNSGLVYHQRESAKGHVSLTDEFISKVQQRCSSALRLISDEALTRGVAQLRQAQQNGDTWLSSYTVLWFTKS